MIRPFAKTLTAMSLAALSVAFFGCEEIDNDIHQGNWRNTYKYFLGTPRGGAVCFPLVINDTLRAVVGTGANMANAKESERFSDFYMFTYTAEGLQETVRYDRLSDDQLAAGVPCTTAIASMPSKAKARNGAVAFTLNNKGYVGLGFDGTDCLNDFWCYDPETNSWTESTPYMGDAVRFAFSFVIDGYAYVGGGEDADNNILGDCYRFDGTNWEPVQSCSVPRSQASAFVCNGKGYLYGGTNGGKISTLECFDPELQDWSQKAQLRDATEETFDDQYGQLAGYGATAFVLDDNTSDTRVYVTTGGPNGSGQLTWEYNPFTDRWVQKASFEGGPRKFSVSFVLNANVDGTGWKQTGFVTTGGTSDLTVSGSNGKFYADTWAFIPNEMWNERD